MSCLFSRFMMTIYIIKSSENSAEVIVHCNDSGVTPSVKKRVVADQMLNDFYAEWIAFFHQSRRLKDFTSDPSIDKEITLNLRKKGMVLTSLLFGSEFIFNTCKKKDSILFSIDPVYANLPVEILIDDNDFITEKYHVFRQIRDSRIDIVQQNYVLSGKLFIMNSDNVDVQQCVLSEKNIITESENKYSDWKIIDCANYAETKFLEELHYSRYIHFAGHTDSTGIPLVSGRKISAAGISELNLRNVEVVFFNSCYSSKQNTSLDSLAQSFIKAGVKNFIGYSLPVRDDIALMVAEYFWNGIRSKKEIHDIISEIRCLIKNNYGEGDLTRVILNYSGTINSKNKSKTKKMIIAAMMIPLIILGLLAAKRYIFTDNNLNNNSNNTAVITKKEEPTVINNKLPEKNLNKKKEQILTDKPKIEKTKTIIEHPADQLSDIINNKVSSTELRQLMIEFISSKHPFYTKTQREKIVVDLINEPMLDSVKIIKLQNERIK